MTGKVTHHDIPNPDWVIVGVQVPDGVVLMASKSLPYAVVREVAADKIYIEQMTAGWMKTGIFLSIHLGVDEFIMAAGETYAEAFAILFGQWQPQRGKRIDLLEIASRQLSIESGANDGLDRSEQGAGPTSDVR